VTDQPLYILAAVAIVGAPLFVFILRGALSGSRYMRARWPIVAVYYGLVAVHEAVGRFGVPVAAPMMILVVLAPFLALFLLVAAPRRSQPVDEERRGFAVEPLPRKDEA
jgi:hypothetical protein